MFKISSDAAGIYGFPKFSQALLTITDQYGNASFRDISGTDRSVDITSLLPQGKVYLSLEVTGPYPLNNPVAYLVGVNDAQTSVISVIDCSLIPDEPIVICCCDCCTSVVEPCEPCFGCCVDPCVHICEPPCWCEHIICSCVPLCSCIPVCSCVPGCSCEPEPCCTPLCSCCGEPCMGVCDCHCEPGGLCSCSCIPVCSCVPGCSCIPVCSCCGCSPCSCSCFGHTPSCSCPLVLP